MDQPIVISRPRSFGFFLMTRDPEQPFFRLGNGQVAANTRSSLSTFATKAEAEAEASARRSRPYDPTEWGVATSHR
jgi:hypothetical protein